MQEFNTKKVSKIANIFHRETKSKGRDNLNNHGGVASNNDNIIDINKDINRSNRTTKNEEGAIRFGF